MLRASLRLRSAFFCVTTLVLLSVLVVGCVGNGGGGGSDQQQEESDVSQQEDEKGASPFAGSFVGEVPDAGAFVAIVADVPEGEGDEREVKAYLCDGQTVSDWFWGSVVGNDLSLSSDSGAQMEGQLTPDAATGTITDPSGDSVAFEASLATGIAGLYNVSVASDGTLNGTSQTGGQMEGQLGNLLEENNTYPVRGTITPPDGQPQDFSALTAPNTADQHRWIVLADGQIKGGNVGGGFEFEGFVFEQRFDCDFDDFDDFDFNHCDDFDFNQFVFVEHFDDFEFERDFDDFDSDDFDHEFDFDRGRGEVGGTFGQVGGGGQGGQGGQGDGKGGQGGGKGGDGGKAGGQDGGNGKGGEVEIPKDVRMVPIPEDNQVNGKVQEEREAAKRLPGGVEDGSSKTLQP